MVWPGDLTYPSIDRRGVGSGNDSPVYICSLVNQTPIPRVGDAIHPALRNRGLVYETMYICMACAVPRQLKKSEDRVAVHVLPSSRIVYSISIC